MLRSDMLLLRARLTNPRSRLTAARSLNQPPPNASRMRAELIPTLIISYYKIIRINKEKLSNADWIISIQLNYSNFNLICKTI